MNLARSLTAALIAVGLAGCFTADEPLLNDGNSIAPYERITFQAEGSDEVNTITRRGLAYVAVEEDEPVVTRFMPLGRPDVYVVEVSGPGNDGETLYLYAIVKVDLAAGTAHVFRAIGDEADVGPGLRLCQDDFVCIDDLAAYVAHGTAAIDAGDEPQVTYEIAVE